MVYAELDAHFYAKKRPLLKTGPSHSRPLAEVLICLVLYRTSVLYLIFLYVNGTATHIRVRHGRESGPFMSCQLWCHVSLYCQEL